MILADELTTRTFQFGRIDGSVIGILRLNRDGTFSGYQNKNEAFWSVAEGKLSFLSQERLVTTVFEEISRDGSAISLRGTFIPEGKVWHTLTEVVDLSSESIIQRLLVELYGADAPFAYVNSDYTDSGYPHTNLMPEIVRSVIDVVQPRFWLELGSMLGGSAIRVADVVKTQAAATEIICIDPFTGDVNMWAWEQPKKKAKEWQFLRLEHGRPTIYERFMANVNAAGHADIILPIMATSIVGIKLLQRLTNERRLHSLPNVIYLDSAHEPDETFLELQNCWNLLETGGVLMGDDWGWDAVRNDVLRFAKTVRTDSNGRQRLAQRHQTFTEQEGILLDQGQWVLVK